MREFWRYYHLDRSFEALALIDGAYRSIETSVILTRLPIDAVRQQVLTVDLLADDWETVQPWQQWLREQKA